MEKRTVITKGILSAVILLGVAFATLWLIRRSPPAHRPPSIANPYAGLDSGYDAIGLAQAWVYQDPGARAWMRLRGIDLGKVPETREALVKLRAKGIKTCVFLRLSSPDWKRKYLPDDLREAYEHGRKLGATYGDLVDAWEVDNEPDLGFVPESAERYTAFLKATYLGLKAGAAEAKEQSGKSKEQSVPSLAPRPSPSATNVPLVIMGSLGLPPGPWLERFAANDGFAYTDGYNYHYYGYADDFTGVYRQHEAALRELGAGSLEPGADSLKLIAKSYPIFLTEVGYGMLGKAARDTKEGRLRQWRWFKSVGEQLATLRPEAPMAFYLPPYLEYDTSEYGLTVPAKQETEVGGQMTDDGRRKTEEWTAGGIKYSPSDFGAEKSEPWMALIGTDIGGNQVTPALAQWLAARNPSGFLASVSQSENRGQAPGGQQSTTASSQPSKGSRAWQIATTVPSPVVIDFLPGEGLSHVKRYNGLFVTGREPPVHTNPETGRRLGADGEANLRPEVTPPKLKIPEPKPETPIPRSEEFILQVRTQNGNLYEVYPTRQATSDWQRFMEPGANFTMAFYGRAALPWRFKENKPASLVVVMYPKQLPATYEFRRPQLIKLSAASSQSSASVRYGQGTVVLYNFSDKPVSGRLDLPPAIGPFPNSPESTADSLFTLAPGERREIPVSIKVPWDRYTPIRVPIAFSPEDTSVPTARYLTTLFPDIGGRPTTLVTNLAPTDNRQLTTNNRDKVATRPRASEEAAMTEQSGWFAQSGAQISRTAEGFTVSVSSIPIGKPQRIEVEIPWPDGLAFNEDEFLLIEFRLSQSSEISGLRSQNSGLSAPNQ